MNVRYYVVGFALGVLGCGQTPEPARPAPRAVSYIELRTTQPPNDDRLTGTVESWKREDIGFEVAGRLLRVVEPGVDIEGRTFDEDGALLSEGTVLASLDPERYVLSQRQAQTVADAARTDLEQLIPQQLAEAESALSLARKELTRYRNLVASQSASQQRLDAAESDEQRAAARVAQVEASRAAKASILASALATVDQAEVNIADCEITSPFTGQVARVHMIPGGYAVPGRPVITVQMMDPMRVQVAVSAEVDKRINYNDRVRVFLPDQDRWVQGLVYLKDTYADPATRTYLVTLLVRNEKVVPAVPESLVGKKVARTKELWTLERKDVGSDGPYYVDTDALHEDEQGFYVWKAENVTAEQLYGSYDPVVRVSKVRVTPGDGRIPALQVFTFRELVDLGGLSPETDVIVGELDGPVVDGVILVSQRRWLLRPGDLVEVALRSNTRPAGFYVPRAALMNDGDQPHLFAVSGESDTARRLPITLHESIGETVRVEAVGDMPLSEGDKIVVGGAHYLADGEPVSLVQRLEVEQ